MSARGFFGLSRTWNVAAIMAVIAVGLAAWGYYWQLGIPSPEKLTVVEGTVTGVREMTTKYSNGPTLVEYEFAVTTPTGEQKVLVPSVYISKDNAAALIGRQPKFGTDGKSTVFTMVADGKEIVKYDSVRERTMSNGYTAMMGAGLAAVLAALFTVLGLFRSLIKSRRLSKGANAGAQAVQGHR